MVHLETLVLGLTLLIFGLGIVAIALLSRAVRVPGDRRSEAFGLVLIGPIPIFFKGKIGWTLVIAALTLLVILLIALGVVV
ncbi:MAG: hypothetical protein NZ988_05180 [Thaumarchaeota archaeon]|nr:hypothetical protein [Candidatus Calditenuaceae archaeon]MDW8187419.1 hypothetical protein [Nitrososphaerota archaeon]